MGRKLLEFHTCTFQDHDIPTTAPSSRRTDPEGNDAPGGAAEASADDVRVSFGSGSLNEADVVAEIAEERFINRLCYLGRLNEKVSCMVDH